MAFAEPPTFVKEATKTPEPAISSKAVKALKESKKRIRGLLNVNTSLSRVLERKGSPELKKSGYSTAAKDSKDTLVSSLEQPQKKKLKHTESQPPPGKFLTFRLIWIEPMYFAYPSNFPNPSPEDLLTITNMFADSKTSTQAITNLSVSVL